MTDSPPRPRGLPGRSPLHRAIGAESFRTWRHRCRTLCCAAALLSGAAARASAQGVAALFARADTAEQQRRFADAMGIYEAAYAQSGFDPLTLALAAGDAALAGLADTAFRDLNRAVDEGYLDDGFFARDSDIFVLHRDARWRALEAKLRERRAALDTALRQELLALAAQDQASRQGMGVALRRYGRASREGDSVLRALDSADAPRLDRVKAIVAAHGWPGRRLVGDDGAHAAWLLVQHAPFAYQQQVLPLFLAAFRRNDARAGDVALLEDRVMVGEGKAQLYGTQTRLADRPGPPVLDSIADEPCVDVRRRSVGLGPLAAYLLTLGVEYGGPPGTCRQP